jgi:hypothetical protein
MKSQSLTLFNHSVARFSKILASLGLIFVVVAFCFARPTPADASCPNDQYVVFQSYVTCVCDGEQYERDACQQIDDEGFGCDSSYSYTCPEGDHCHFLTSVDCEFQRPIASSKGPTSSQYQIPLREVANLSPPVLSRLKCSSAEFALWRGSHSTKKHSLTDKGGTQS